jgi:cobalt/nickel transport system ATP-binding protein
VLVGTAPLHRTFAAAHRLKVPGLLVLLALLTHRYAFLLMDELRRLRTALWVRGFRTRANSHGYRTLGSAIGIILVRGSDRAERVAAAMRSRGFDGRFHTLAAFHTKAKDVILFLVIVLAATGLIAWDRFIMRNAERGMGNEEPSRASAIRISCLSHIYADGRKALDDLSFAIEPEECVAVVGPNGAGKTTLFLRLCGVLAGPLGQASVSGLDPADSKQRKRLPQTVGVVFQNPDDQLFAATVEEDVAFGPLNLGLRTCEAKSRAAEALVAVGMDDAGGRVPFHLSGGEKRRAALAGVLAMRPAILLLDEPSMFLDPRGRREFIAIVRSLPGTKLIATHDLELVLDLCSRVLVLDGGKLLADGPTQKLLADPELMDRHGLEVPYRLRKGSDSLRE